MPVLSILFGALSMSFVGFLLPYPVQATGDSSNIVIRQFQAPINPDRFLIRPGQSLIVTFLQSSLPAMELTVNAEGAIVHSSFGRVDVSAATETLATLRTKLLKHLRTFFKTELIDVSVSEPATVAVDISGEIARPGRYRLSNALTLADLVDSAGGILPGGSSRHLAVLATDSTAVDLLRGRRNADELNNPYLYAIRSVVVPVSGPVALLAGDIRIPGAVEFLPSDHLTDLFLFAGGLYGQRLDSVLSGGVRVAPPYSLSAANDGQSFTIFTAEGGRVSISGAVARPSLGESPRRSLAQLLTSCGGLAPRADSSRLVVWRRIANQSDRTISRLPLVVSESQFATFSSEPGDSVAIPFKRGYVELDLNGRLRILPLSAHALVHEILERAGIPAIVPGQTSLSLRDGLTGLESPATLATPVFDGDRVILREKDMSK